MKNILLLFSIGLMVSCTKNSVTKETELVPTATEKKIIDAASVFFKSGGNGDYYKIVGNYWVALHPILELRRSLTEGPCTQNIFQTQCCCPWNFSLTPYDAINGSITRYNYPKSALFTARPEKMRGMIAATFDNRPVSSDITRVQYSDLAFTATNINLNGAVAVKDMFVSPFSNNVMCTAEFSNNSFIMGSEFITSITGHLSFSDADASGKLNITFSDNRNIVTEITTVKVANYTYILQTASFTMDGIRSDIHFDKWIITIGDRTFKLNL